MLDDITIDDIIIDDSVPIDFAVIEGQQIKTWRYTPPVKPSLSTQVPQTLAHPRVFSHAPLMFDEFPEPRTIAQPLQATSFKDLEAKERIVPNKPLKLGKIPFFIPLGFDANRVVRISRTFNRFQELLPVTLTPPKPKQQELSIVVEAIKGCPDPTFRQSYLTEKLRNKKINALLIKEILTYLVNQGCLLIEDNENYIPSKKGGRKPLESYHITAIFKELYHQEGE